MLEIAPIRRLSTTCRSVLIQPAIAVPILRESQSPARPSRCYATSSTSIGTTAQPTTRRRQVTVFNDDGKVKWGDLSPVEKAARTTQQSFNFGLIAVGAAATIAVFTFMYTDVFSPQSATSHFNRAVDRIRKDDRIVELLGKGSEISAFGEPSWNKWRRNRPIASRTETDKFGTERLYMHFNVAGPLNRGTARLHMLRRRDESEFHYGYLVVDVDGHSRVTIESADANEKKKSTPGRFLGIKWS